MRFSRLILTLAAAVITAVPLTAQTSKKIEEQRKVIAELERSIEQQEKQLSSLKKDKASAQKRVSLLTRQIERRNSLINATNRQIKNLTEEVEASNERLGKLSDQLSALEANCREMTREAYRNYRFHNAMAYIFSSESFAQMAERLAALRTATEKRGERMKMVVSVRDEEQREREELNRKREDLARTKKDLDRQHEKLRQDVKSARSTVSRMSKKEQSVLRAKLEKEEKLDEAIKQLRKLTKGNKSGASFSTRTKGLNLPVRGGRVTSYNGNMAEIKGSEGAAVRSIYEGKVVQTKRNKINNKYDVYIAHGEYISSYANLSSVCVERGQTVARDQQIGTIGPKVNLSTMEVEYRLLFGIYAPSPSVSMQASNLFKK